MGFKEARKQLLECIDAGKIQHEIRKGIDAKNLLFSGKVSMKEVRETVNRAGGSEYSVSPHHQVKNIDVNVIKAKRGALKGWYIKWYFIEPDAWFISIHE